MREFVAVVRALSNLNRVRMCAALRSGRLCACHLANLTGMPTNIANQHLAVLARAGLVRSVRGPRWKCYELAGSNAPRVARDALEWTRRTLADEVLIRADAARLAVLLRRYAPEACAAGVPRPSKYEGRRTKRAGNRRLSHVVG